MLLLTVNFHDDKSNDTVSLNGKAPQKKSLKSIPLPTSQFSRPIILLSVPAPNPLKQSVNVSVLETSK